MENAAHTVQLSVAGGSLAGCEVSHWHTNTQRIIRAAHGNIPRTGGMTARLLKSLWRQVRRCRINSLECALLSARNLFHNSFCRKNICEMDRKKEECIRSRTACSATRLHASRPVIQINFLPRFMPLYKMWDHSRENASGSTPTTSWTIVMNEVCQTNVLSFCYGSS